ncbi:hypothetical protein [Streptomyces sp. WAC06614]|uniref:hypothetical protein n=1 Tax=Streptomyces sp. WAC06614 TaxID=2487416 RepID=UPI000F76E91D|nr:hypothetical protein [Streptomyces sp. WAC06614]RSS80726.1 hypothetical protein EF918_12755 [Streptomyces sp. WAC06614]
MFEIRVICDPSDVTAVSAALEQAFNTGAVRQMKSRTPGKERLYITADHRAESTTPWPTPEEAYAKAPSVISEIGWTARHVRDALKGADLGDTRVFWLRKAAVLDRIALDDARHGAEGDALVAAIEAAHRFRVCDASASDTYNGTPHDAGSDAAFMNPRGYPRQEYAAWIHQQ